MARIISVMASLCLALVMASHPGIVAAGEQDLDDSLNAKLAKAKSQARREGHQRNARNTDEDNETDDPDPAECGAISIGNVSGGGIGSVPRENTVIITGDVINMGNECK